MASLHDLQWVTSHNSYLASERSNDPAFDVDAFYDAGVRGLELDIWKKTGSWSWSVNHTEGFRANCRVLDEYLHAISSAWTDDREPMFLHIDCKDSAVLTAFPDSLDDCLREHLGEERLFSPKHMIGADGQWQEWPAPDAPEITGRLVVVISGSEQLKAQYAGRGRAVALGFPDFDPYRTNMKTGPRLIANTQYQDAYLGGQMGKWRCERKALLWRVYSEGKDASKWLKTWLPSGANMLALDFDGGDVKQNGSAFWPNPLCP